MGTNWTGLAKRARRDAVIQSGKKIYMKGQPNDDNCVARCHDPIHAGKLSKHMLKQHQCLQKNCKYLEKCLDHPYWQYRGAMNRMKKSNKNNQNRQGVNVKARTGRAASSGGSSMNVDLKKFLSEIGLGLAMHVYIFQNNDPTQLSYIGGYYDFDTAMAKARERITDTANAYVVMISEIHKPSGYRFDPRSKYPIEIDLTWSDMYRAFARCVSRDFSFKQKYTKY